MSIKSKVFAAAATLTLVGGVGAAGMTAGTAGAATPSCGHHCIDIFNRSFSSHTNPSFVLDVLRQGEKVGQPVILFRASNNDPAEDFTVSYQGQVSDFLAAGLVSPSLALHYGGGCKFWSPRHQAVNDLHVALEPCGVTAKTVWVQDIDNATGFYGSYAPYINGSDNNFSNPYVLDYPHNSYPTDMPRAQLIVQQLALNAHHNIVNDTQLWSAVFGTLR
jgi:hypothetical protein